MPSPRAQRGETGRRRRHGHPRPPSRAVASAAAAADAAALAAQAAIWGGPELLTASFPAGGRAGVGSWRSGGADSRAGKGDGDGDGGDGSDDDGAAVAASWPSDSLRGGSHRRRLRPPASAEREGRGPGPASPESWRSAPSAAGDVDTEGARRCGSWIMRLGWVLAGRLGRVFGPTRTGVGAGV